MSASTSSVLARAGLRALRHHKPKGGHSPWPNGSFWSEGTQTGRNGYLFGETPPPAGHARKWESWEFVTYVGFGTSAIMAYLIANGPDNSLQAWAKPYAEAELREEDALFAEYAADASAREAAAAALRAQGAHADRYYDKVMMRNEFEVLKAKAGA
jgi:hypothetical protein